MWFYIPAGVIFFLDRFTKHWVKQNFSPGDSFPLWGNYLWLTYVKNKGALFGLFPEIGLFLILGGIGVVGFVFFFRRKWGKIEHLTEAGLGFILGGALGNLWDRIFWGGVLDFLDLRVWPVFNVADVAVCLGVGILIWRSLWGIPREAK